MSHPSNSHYLESKVLTASQPQLHIMLLDAALRFGQLAQTMWTADADFLAVDPLLEKMANIVDELTHGTATATEKISQQFEEQYAFVYRELAACRINRDPAQLQSCLKLLAYQRETWKLAAERLEAETAIPAAATTLHLQPHSSVAEVGFSLDA